MERSLGSDRLAGPRPGAGVLARALCASTAKRAATPPSARPPRSPARAAQLTLLLVTSFRDQRSRRPRDQRDRRARDRRACGGDRARGRGLADDRGRSRVSTPADVVLDWTEGHDLLAIGAPASSWLGGHVRRRRRRLGPPGVTVPLLTARPATHDGGALRSRADRQRRARGLRDAAHRCGWQLADRARLARHAASRCRAPRPGRGPAARPARAAARARRSRNRTSCSATAARTRSSSTSPSASGASLVVIGSRRRSGPRAAREREQARDPRGRLLGPDRSARGAGSEQP